jgi:glycosyltransferase involved in cell wall biosynthesis
MTVDVTRIRNFVKSEPSARATFLARIGIPEDAPVILFLGRLVEIKGLSVLLDAWKQVCKAVPSARLIIAGDGELREVAQSAAAGNPSVCAVGRLSGEDVWRAYAAADIFVAPSVIEPWGLVVNEAMAAGTPMIVTDVIGCVGDLAIDNETALLVPPRDADALAQALTRLLNEPATRERLARAASELISDWTIEAEAERVTAVWRRLLLDASRPVQQV